MLSIEGLRKGYRQHCAVDGVTFAVEPGQVVGLLGPNGAGKTTTLKCALGLIEPTAGRVTICGFDVRKQRRDALRRVGAVLEGSRNVFWRLSPLENLLYFANLMGVPTPVARKQAASLLERFGLAERLHQQVGELSRGMQQKVAVCAALIRNPQLLLLDEPTLGLDVETAIQLKETLATLAREEGRALVVTSHQMELAEELCDRVIIMQKGRVVADEQVERLLAMFATRSYRFHTERPLSDTCASQNPAALSGCPDRDRSARFSGGGHLCERGATLSGGRPVPGRRVHLAIGGAPDP